MKLALILVATVALGLGVTIRTASAGENPQFCCGCFDCGQDVAAATNGGAAGSDQIACYTGFGEDPTSTCLDLCGSLGCDAKLFKGACSPTFCATIDQFAQAATTPAPLFQPLGMVLAVLAAALAGGWSLLLRRRSW